MWDGAYHHTRTDLQLAGTIGSAGTAVDAIGSVPEGYCWYVERLTSYSNTANATTGKLEIFVSNNPNGPTAPDKTGREDVATGTSVQDSTSDQRSPIYLGPGQYLVAQWSALTQNDVVRVTSQIRVHELLRNRGPVTAPADHHDHGVEKAAAAGNALHATAAIMADAVA